MTFSKKLKINFLLILSTLLASSYSLNTLADQRGDLLKMANKKESGKYVRAHFSSLLKKPFTSSAKKKVLIIGDSHAQDFVNAILESGNFKNHQLSAREIPTRCQPILGGGATQLIAAKDKAFCAKSDNLAKAKGQIAKAEIVILVANWKEWSATALPNTIKNLQLTPQQQLLVIGRKSFGKVSIRNYLRLSEKELRNLQNKVDGVQEKINNTLKSTLDKAVFIDIQQLICGSPSSCRVFTSDLKLISFDGGHLTKEGARYVGNILFKNSQLKNL